MICIRMSGETTWNYFNTETNEGFDQLLELIKLNFDGKEFLHPCTFIEKGKAYRIGITTVDEVTTNFIWEVNEENYDLFRAEIKKAYEVELPASSRFKGWEENKSVLMDDTLFEFFEELKMRYDYHEVYANHTFKFNGFSVVI